MIGRRNATGQPFGQRHTIQDRFEPDSF